MGSSTWSRSPRHRRSKGSCGLPGAPVPRRCASDRSRPARPGGPASGSLPRPIPTPRGAWSRRSCAPSAVVDTAGSSVSPARRGRTPGRERRPAAAGGRGAGLDGVLRRRLGRPQPRGAGACEAGVRIQVAECALDETTGNATATVEVTSEKAYETVLVDFKLVDAEGTVVATTSATNVQPGETYRLEMPLSPAGELGKGFTCGADTQATE